MAIVLLVRERTANRPAINPHVKSTPVMVRQAVGVPHDGDVDAAQPQPRSAKGTHVRERVELEESGVRAHAH